jgi:hypothetical protein
MQDIDLPPYAPMLIESTRAIGYSLESAIADIIDNSISASAKTISINYTPYDDPYIAIIDDGYGMSEEKLTESMRYGCTDPTNERDSKDMGRYGLGMKTASLSQCLCLTVVTMKAGRLCARRWDVDHIKTTGRWSLIALEDGEIKQIPFIKMIQEYQSGTLVLLQKLDKVFSGEINRENAMTEKMDLVSKHLALVFHRFLQGGDAYKKITLNMNGEDVKGFDPFFTSKSRQVMDDEPIKIRENGYVRVYPFVLPHPSVMTKFELEKYGGKDGLRRLQGFYVYRNKRLLIWGTWFRMTKMDEFSKLARVRIDIPNSLDDLWTLDVKKSTAIPPEIVKTRLKQILHNIVGNSKQTYTFRVKQETRDDISHVWNVLETRDGIRYELNSAHPLYEKLSEMIGDDAKQLLDNYADSIANKFPVTRLHNDIFNEKKIIRNSDVVEFDNVKEQLKIFLKSAETNEEKNSIVQHLLGSEPFYNYSERINHLISEDEL